MVEERAQRRLAAILAADVVGYSRLLEEDEAGTLAVLKERRRKILNPLVAEHHGRIVKVMGDGVLVEFGSAVNAVACAVELQKRMAAANDDLPENQRVTLRIGINLGDVVVEGSDLYGDGVNIAARLEALADPGSVIVSRTVLHHVRGKVKFGFDDLGERQLKNIGESVRIYRLRPDGEAAMARPALALPDKPSIAVLPFHNLSGDPAQEYFADGISEAIITALSRFRHLFVIARNSSFAYKGRAADVKQVGRELGVRYVLEGSLRRSDERLRATAQLIETETGHELWAERYDRSFVDQFAIEDELTQAIVAAIEHVLVAAEHRRGIASGLGEERSLNQKAGWHLFRFTREDNAKAIELLRKAIAENPHADRRYQGLALALGVDLTFGWAERPEETIAAMVAAAERGVSLGEHDAWNHVPLSWGLVFARQFERAIAELGRTIELNPNSGLSYGLGAVVLGYCGDAIAALEELDKVRRMAPQAPFMFYYLFSGALGLFRLGRYGESADMAESAALRRLNYFQPQVVLAAALAFAGETSRARAALGAAHRLAPALSAEWLKPLVPLRETADFEHLIDGLRKAGLPE